MNAIEAGGLTRRSRSLTAVDHVSFTVAAGEVSGFLGPNGAGKSTTARMLTGYVAPTEGTTLLDGCESICTRATSLEDVFLHLTAASSIASGQPADAPG